VEGWAAESRRVAGADLAAGRPLETMEWQIPRARTAVAGPGRPGPDPDGVSGAGSEREGEGVGVVGSAHVNPGGPEFNA
jgi:hypothetical protein